MVFSSYCFRFNQLSCVIICMKTQYSWVSNYLCSHIGYGYMGYRAHTCHRMMHISPLLFRFLDVMVRWEIIRDVCGSARLSRFVQNTSFIMLVRALFHWVAGHSTLMKYCAPFQKILKFMVIIICEKAGGQNSFW